jgi:hypothetical protein
MTDNYGFSGLAITLPKVLQEFEKHTSDDLVRHDEQAQYVAKTLVDLTEGIYTLAKLLRYDANTRRVYNRTMNREKYYDYSAARSFVQGKIESLMNNVLIIGEQALELLETMWGHMQRVSEQEPDEFAFRLARGCYNGVMENEG